KNLSRPFAFFRGLLLEPVFVWFRYLVDSSSRGIAKKADKWQNARMKTLAEIERAAEELPIGQRTELLLFLAESLRKEQAHLPEPRLFSEEQLKTWMDEDEEAMRRFKAGA